MKEQPGEKPKKEETAIEIPADQIEVIDVAPENIHLEGEADRPRSQKSGFQFKTYSFGTQANGQPIVVSLWKPLLGCTLFLLILFGIFASFVVGVFKLLQKLISLIF